MRIALRTSGGRGEYELAGTQNGIHNTDVFNRQIALQLFPEASFLTQNFVKHVQGKPRIRLNSSSSDAQAMHIYRTLANALMLPKAKRELGTTPGGNIQLTEYNYSITSVHFDIVSLDDKIFTVQPTDIIVSNSEGLSRRIDFVERLRIVFDIWEKASLASGPISDVVNAHKRAVFHGDVASLSAVMNRFKKLLDFDDPLRQLVQEFRLEITDCPWLGLHSDPEIDNAIELAEEDQRTSREAIRNRIQRWRLQAERGQDAVKFSVQVKSAYNNRCLFTGYHLPKTEISRTPGVDSAHILPWAHHNINSVNNGICLSKLCHWAFDSGIIRLQYQDGDYFLHLSNEAVAIENNGGIDLSAFRPTLGRIAKERLPKNRADWPFPEYIERFNQVLFSGI